jgi:hypothetical protein
VNKTEFVERIVAVVDRGEADLSPRVSARLADARLAALRVANQRQQAIEAGGIGALSARLGGVFSPARAGFAALALAALTLSVVQWQSRDPWQLNASQPESIDLALLVDEAPLSAYTRPDFDSCLNRSC